MEKTFQFSRVVLTMLFAILLNSSCNDDNEKTKLIDINDPNAVTKAIEIENSNFVSNNYLPSQTINETAPILDTRNDGELLLSVQGSKIIVSAFLESGNASGFYVSITGAAGYYKVTSTSSTARKGLSKLSRNAYSITGRTTNDDPNFSIEIPVNIGTGEFCISYCVYDEQNQVSNTIRQCIVVKSLGGNNSSFLTSNIWTVDNIATYENGSIVYESHVGVPETEYFETIINCNGSNKSVDAYFVSTVKYYHLTISENGTTKNDSEHYVKFVDYENSECTVAYIEDVVVYNDKGLWSYDDASKKLILIYNIEIDGHFETTVLQYQASIVNNNLILKTDYGESEYTILTLKNKN